MSPLPFKDTLRRTAVRWRERMIRVTSPGLVRSDLCTQPAVLLVVMLAVSSSAWAQSSLPDLSLEDLMKLDAGQVFGASERLQPVTEAPASVSFITAEEIARYGYRTLADILRGVRGMYVTDDRNFSLIGTRGFAKPGDYNSRILLLVNGHRVNDNVFGQAEIGAEFGLDPAMFERVEIIRGPASSLYGDSAFFAVVNVITRTGASLGGGSVTLEAGTLGTQLVRGQRRAPPRERRGRGAVGHLRAQRWRRAALLPGVRYAGHQQRRGGGARWRRRQAVLRPPGLQGPDRDRRVRQPAAGRADRLVRHAVQRAGVARSRRPIVTRWSMRSTGARSAARA